MIANAGRSKTNACRNLHNLIHKKKMLFPVAIDAVRVHVSLRRPFLRKEQLWWPILRLEHWVQALMARTPEILLAGYGIHQRDNWSAIFNGFWQGYESCNPCHPIFTSSLPRSHSIPYFLHGDEGKTLRQRSFMIHSFQPCISKYGPWFAMNLGTVDEQVLFLCIGVLKHLLFQICLQQLGMFLLSTYHWTLLLMCGC